MDVSIEMSKVIIEKSRGEGSLLKQDTIENVSKHKFFYFKENKIIFLTSFNAKNVFTVCNVFLPQKLPNRPKFLFHKNLPPRDFSIMTLETSML